MLGGCVIVRSISIDSLELEGDALHISQIQFHASLRLLVISYHLALILKAYILHFLTSRLLISSLGEFRHFLVEIPEGIVLIALIHIIRCRLRARGRSYLRSFTFVCSICTHHIRMESLGKPSVLRIEFAERSIGIQTLF